MDFTEHHIAFALFVGAMITAASLFTAVVCIGIGVLTGLL